jgi:hypothetical protein
MEENVFTDCIKMFRDEKVEETIFLSRKLLIIDDEVAYKRMIKNDKLY